mgnify:CR=1 FL=1|tara:strand:+ start:2889 stop:3440 length:552 start_codon:yes stop_codon:yes gene_type:complete
MRLTEKTHFVLKNFIKNGDYLIDATAGNGHDTVFLAEETGPTGHVYAFDIQKESIEETTQRIRSKEFHKRVTFFHCSHSEIPERIPCKLHGKIKAITFNLGYLPGGNKNLITKAETTLLALKKSYSLLVKHGKISIIAYRGHAGGKTEYESVKNYISNNNLEHESFACDTGSDSPVLFIITKS